MKVLDVIQGSPEWLALRRTKVGASDIAALMAGTDREIYNLFWEKFGEEKYQTSAMRRGSEMESEARKWFEEQHDVIFERPVALHDDHDWLLASFDGLNFDLGLSLEIKCPNEVPESVEASKSWKRYYWQVQAQLAVGGHEKAIVLVYGPDKQVQTVVDRNEEDIAKLLKQGAWFFDLMQKNTPPPEPIVVRDDAEAVEFAEAAKLLKKQIDDLDEQWKILRDGGIYLANETSFQCNGVKVTKILARPSVDYRAAFESMCPNADVSAFLRPSKPSWRISV